MSFLRRAPLLFLLAACATPGGEQARTAHLAERAGDWNAAAQLWNQVLVLRGEGDVEASLGYARALVALDQGGLAHEVLLRAADRAPRDGRAEVLVAQADLERAQGRYRAAEVTYQAAITADPRDASAWEGRGHNALSLGDLDLARRSFVAALELGSTDPGVPPLLARAARDTDEPADEFLAYQVDAELRAGGVARLAALSSEPAVLAVYPEARAEVIGWLGDQLARDPNGFEVHRVLAEVLMDDGRAREALPVAQRAAELDPAHPAGLGVLVRALVAEGRDPSAITEHARGALSAEDFQRWAADLRQQGVTLEEASPAGG